jgi:hypothetical protein
MINVGYRLLAAESIQPKPAENIKTQALPRRRATT